MRLPNRGDAAAAAAGNDDDADSDGDIANRIEAADNDAAADDVEEGDNKEHPEGSS